MKKLLVTLAMAALGLCVTQTAMAEDASNTNGYGEEFRVLNDSEFMALSPDAQDEYMDELRDVLVELSSNDTLGASRFFVDGSPAQRPWEKGYAALLGLVAPQAHAEDDDYAIDQNAPANPACVSAKMVGIQGMPGACFNPVPKDASASVCNKQGEYMVTVVATKQNVCVPATVYKSANQVWGENGWNSPWRAQEKLNGMGSTNSVSEIDKKLEEQRQARYKALANSFSSQFGKGANDKAADAADPKAQFSAALKDKERQEEADRQGKRFAMDFKAAKDSQSFMAKIEKADETRRAEEAKKTAEQDAERARFSAKYNQPLTAEEKKKKDEYEAKLEADKKKQLDETATREAAAYCGKYDLTCGSLKKEDRAKALESYRSNPNNISCMNGGHLMKYSVENKASDGGITTVRKMPSAGKAERCPRPPSSIKYGDYEVKCRKEHKGQILCNPLAFDAIRSAPNSKTYYGVCVPATSTVTADCHHVFNKNRPARNPKDKESTFLASEKIPKKEARDSFANALSKQCQNKDFQTAYCDECSHMAKRFSRQNKKNDMCKPKVAAATGGATGNGKPAGAINENK